VPEKQAMQVPWANPEAGGEIIHRGGVEESIVDEAQRATDHGRRAQPRCGAGRCFRTASQTGPVPGIGGRGCAGEIADVAALRVGRRTNRTAVDPGRGDRDKKFAVEARVAAHARPVERANAHARDFFHPWRP
jgi:hypothetical protein